MGKGVDGKGISVGSIISGVLVGSGNGVIVGKGNGVKVGLAVLAGMGAGARGVGSGVAQPITRKPRSVIKKTRKVTEPIGDLIIQLPRVWFVYRIHYSTQTILPKRRLL